MQAGFFPGCVYLISCWYKRYEVQTRLAFFYMSSIFASGFSVSLISTVSDIRVSSHTVYREFRQANMPDGGSSLLLKALLHVRWQLFVGSSLSISLK